MITKKSSLTRFTLEVMGFRLAPTRPRLPTTVPETWAEGPDLPSLAGKGGLPAFPHNAGPDGGRGEKKRGGEREGSPRGQYPPCQESLPGSPDHPRRPARSEGRVLEEGRPKPQSRNANSTEQTTGPKRKRKSLRLSHLHPPAQPSPGGIARDSGRGGLKVAMVTVRRLTAPAGSLGPLQSSSRHPRPGGQPPALQTPPSFPSAIFELTPRARAFRAEHSVYPGRRGGPATS